MSNKVHKDQLSLFELDLGGGKPTPSERISIARLIRLRDERRVVVSELKRLKPDEDIWKAEKERWRGVVNFKYPHNKYLATEARGIVRFLNNAEQMIRNLNWEIDEIEKALGIAE